MTSSRRSKHLSFLKNALAVLGAIAGASMSPIALAADPPGGHLVNGAAAKGSAGVGSVHTALPAVQRAPQGADQQKGKCDKSAPAGAGQVNCNAGDGELIGLLRPVGPNGTQQSKLDSTKPKPGQ
jgi:hypothetical protein